MPAYVPIRPTTLSAAPVKSGLVVGGVEWKTYANEYNHLVGGSACIVPLHAPDVTVAAAATGVLRYYTHPRYQATHRRWFIAIGTASGFADVTITFPNTETTTMRATTGLGCAQYDEALAPGDRGSTAGEIGMTIDNDAASTGSAVVRFLACYELARPELAIYTDSDAGVSADTLGSGLPIFYDGTGLSFGGVVAQIAEAFNTARRPGFFAASPYYTTTSAVFAAPYIRGFVVRARKFYRTSTTGTMTVAAYGSTPVGTVGEVRFTMTGGATTTLTFPSGTAAAWKTGTIAIDCDDFGDSYGRRSSRFDKCVVEARRASGAGTFALDHFGGGEAKV